ncbi:hypothetical protein [Carboxylicivirga sp. M1479]|uniref:hypothetical protein n=1 Tax=Carboxylicivirga sp. M1479 TaxID=2594476 RepID=UPI0011784EBF|nr:hypothetical protein [Carboxylicivirga sp. M1479]TRX70232.1 hypothetical protein FNN09_12155 [Carboxylicivirga sp. M1479]
MEKEALINIILNDIKEVHNLVNSFKGKEELNSAFINLTRTKIANINEELSLLEQLNVQKTNNPISESSLTSEITNTSSTKDNRAIAESSSEFVKAESNIEANAPLVETNQIEEKQITPTIEKTSVIDEIISSDKETDTTPEEVSSVSEEISISEQDVANEADERVNDKQDTVSESKDKKPAAVSNTSHKGSSKPKASVNNKPNVLGEVINKDNSSVNDKLATQKEEVQDVRQIGKPVDDVRKAFGLNDRFYYQRELFNNKADLFNQTLEQINAMDSYQSAKEFLKANYNWSDDNQATESFFNSIKRRFI